MRLDQYISQGLNISRKQAKQLISQGRISVDGSTVKKANEHIKAEQQVSFENKPVALINEQYILLHKPAGYCCSHEDDGYPSALTLLKQEHISKKKLFFAGRLDADTTGLVLLSTDGQWCHRITSPKQQRRKQKGYRCRLAEPISDAALSELTTGILLHGETHKTLPATLQRLGPCELNLFIEEGRYHQVKRMFAAVGNRITALHRFSIGNIQLDGDLTEGQYRNLSDTEIKEFMHAAS